MTTQPVPRTRLRVWLQLLRAPNLFTVPGDPVAGYLLANGWQVDRTLPLAIIASLCLYAAGLLMNDLADEAEDRRERPGRPLPARQASRKSVWATTILLSLAGLGALGLTGSTPAMIAGLALLAAVTLYNWVTKAWPVVGALNMGLCRSLSVMLGGLVGPLGGKEFAVGAALGFGLYIAAVTKLARHETRPRAPILARVLPALTALLIAFGGIREAINAPDKTPSAAIFLLAAGTVIYLAWKMLARPSPLPPLIGAHIRVLLPFQAAMCFLAEPTEIGLYCAIALLALWPVSRVVGRWFYAS